MIRPEIMKIYAANLSAQTKKSGHDDSPSAAVINVPDIGIPMVHGGMHYRCEDCGKEWIMWLEIGVEDHGRHGRPHQPCPFVIMCDCGGFAQHVDWHKDIQLPGPRPIGDGMRYFSYDHSGEDRACGHATVYQPGGDRP